MDDPGAAAERWPDTLFVPAAVQTTASPMLRREREERG
jgi:hypothetical protein